MQDCVLPVLKVKIVMLERLTLRPNDGNISQNCWSCICKLRPNDRNIHKSWMKNLTSFKFEPTILNISQHVTTGWPITRNMLHPTMLHMLRWNLTIVSPGLKNYAPAQSYKQPNKISIEFTYSDFSCHLEVNRSTLELINRQWKCKQVDN